MRRAINDRSPRFTSRQLHLTILFLPLLFLSLTLSQDSASSQVRYQTHQPRAIEEETNTLIPFSLITIDRFNPRNPHCKAIGDIDGDGFLDVLAASSTNYTEGLFWYQYPSWTKTRITTGSFSTSMAVGDVDGDGDLDAIMGKGDYYGYTIWWYENPRPSGNPSTSAWTEHYIGDAMLHDVIVGDITKDGKLDIIVRASVTTTLFAQGTGSTWTKKIISNRPFEGTALGDIDGDGDLDIAINGYWLENPLPSGSPTSATWVERPVVASWPEKSSAHLADVNADGKLDILLAPSETANGRLSWFESPNPRTDPWTEHVIDAAVSYVHTLLTGDMNNDGALDIVTAEMHQSDNRQVSIYANLGGAVSWNQQIISTLGSHNARLGDVDADGDIDIVGANWDNTSPTGATIQMWENLTLNSLRTLDSWQRHVVDAARPWQSIFVTSADLDRDGRKDIVSGGWWYKNPGAAGGNWIRSTIGPPLNNMATVFDFDNNGTLDILGTQGVGSNASAQFVWARNDSLGQFTILSNIAAGDGDFLQGVEAARFINQASEPVKVALSWHIAGKGIQMLSVPEDPSDGTWSWSRISTTSQDEQLSAADLDRDGLIDLMMGTKWQKNNGGSWAAYSVHNPAGTPDRNRVGDINNDGKLDVVVGYEAINVLGRLAWYEQPGSATSLWTQHVISDSVVGPMSLDLADMDHDGDLDVVVGEHNYATPQSARLLVFENTNGIGTSWTKHIVFTGDEHHDGAHVVDIDNDGDLDIVSIGWENYKTILYENKSNTIGGGTTAPTIGVHPSNQVVTAGQPATFMIVASGSAPLSYQWQRNAVNISGATTQSFVIPATVAADNGSSFKCIVSNPYGTVTSNSALLTVSNAGLPVVTVQPTNRTITAGQTATFSVTASSNTAMSYQWTRNGSVIPGATLSAYTTPVTTAQDNGAAFRCIVSNSSGSATSNIATLTVVPLQTQRVSNSLQVLYTFEEGSGNTVNDVSGVGSPLNLTIADPANTSWGQGYLSVNSSTIVSSAAVALKVIDACKQSNEISVEAWVKPASASQNGPARIVTISADATNRDFTLAQGISGGSSDALEVRRRTSTTTSNGTPSLTTPPGTFTTQLTHVVVTRSNAGTTKVYLNGTEISSENTGGTFSTWANYKFALANELTNDRPWLGQFHLVAVYSRALSAAEVSQNYSSGANTSQFVYANVKAFLQGPYSTPADSMLTSIRSLLPSSQPYTSSPWSYSGTESVASMPPRVVDWLLVELRTGTSANTRIAVRAGLLLSSGVVVDTDGYSPLQFQGIGSGNYYIVVRHRNHLAVMSANAVSLGQSGELYDFSTNSSASFGSSALSQLKSGVFGLTAGDANSSAIVSSSDANNVFGALNQAGYSNNDINLSGIVTAADVNVLFGNLNKATQVP
ncbi:MAG: VCBS repeat-containing protein [Ignavibacteriae bacterium]|nr:VCBS repeat-containing protein [Ignavibacteriota bacterium]